MGSLVHLDKEDGMLVNKLVMNPTEVTDYVKNSQETRFVTVVKGKGVVTIDTVDFRVQAPHTLMVQPNQEYLYANTSTEEVLVVIEVVI
jgi:mannose-6-phosphate isomerase-like protein (cupin superfamily)